MTDNAAGWQPDPTGKHDHRYWDGTQWTENVSDAGVTSTDPYEAPAPEAVDAVDEAPQGDEAAAATPGSTDPTVATTVPADTTASYPTAATPPPIPPAYVPPAPVVDGGDNGDGSKRRLLIGVGILALVALTVAAFLALGGDDESSVRTKMASAIEASTDLTSDQAECVADLIVDQAGEDAFDNTDFTASDPPPEFVTAVAQVGFDKMDNECGVDEAAFSGSGGSTDSTDGSSAGEQSIEDLETACDGGDFAACDDLYHAADPESELQDFGSTCGGTAEPQEGKCEATNGGTGGSASAGVPDDLEESITNTFKAAYGISQDQAECLAHRIVEAVDDGDVSPEQAVGAIFDYLSDCDISLEELGAN